MLLKIHILIHVMVIMHIQCEANFFQFSIFHTVILDLKALYLLLVKLDDENFQLGKRGIEVECCFICKALRVCVPL